MPKISFNNFAVTEVLIFPVCQTGLLAAIWIPACPFSLHLLHSNGTSRIENSSTTLFKLGGGFQNPQWDNYCTVLLQLVKCPQVSHINVWEPYTMQTLAPSQSEA